MPMTATASGGWKRWAKRVRRPKGYEAYIGGQVLELETPSPNLVEGMRRLRSPAPRKWNSNLWFDTILVACSPDRYHSNSVVPPFFLRPSSDCISE